jgi:hypothetical protein
LHELVAGSVREWIADVVRTFMVSNRFDMFFAGADFEPPLGGAVFGVELMAMFAILGMKRQRRWSGDEWVVGRVVNWW